jgi:hypothetical protein
LAPSAAEAGDVEFEAGKGLEAKKAEAAVAAKIKETTTLAKDKDFMAGETEMAKAKGAANIRAAEIRAESIKDRPASGGGSSAVKVRSTYTNSDGLKIAVMSDGTEKTLGKAGDYDKTLSNLVTKMAKDDYKFAKLPENEKRKQAEERLRGQIVVPNATRDLSKYERDAKAD